MTSAPSAVAGKRIAVVAAEPMRVAGFESLFADNAGIEVVSMTAVQALRAKDLSMAVIDGSAVTHLFEMLETFRRSRPALKLLVIGPSGDHAVIQKIVGAGAKGYLPVSAPLSEVLMAVEVVLDGSIWAPRKVMARLLDSTRAAEVAAQSAPMHLTGRERDVLGLLVGGGSNREIAGSLGIDEATVKAHVGRLLRKFGVTNRTALTVRAMQRKLG